MSTDNVTPFRGHEPPNPPEPPEPPASLPDEEEISVAFKRGRDHRAWRAWCGLRGVICAMRSMEGTAEDAEQYLCLSEAAWVLFTDLESMQP